MGKERARDFWKDIADDENVEGPPENDRNNGPHGLKNGISERFTTVLQCVIDTIAMSEEFLKD